MFLKSDKPEEIVLAILAGKFKEKYKIIKDVIEKITELRKERRKL